VTLIIFLVHFNAWHAFLGNATLKDITETTLNNWTPLDNQLRTLYQPSLNQDGIFSQLLMSQPSEATSQKNLARQPIFYQEKTFIMALVRGHSEASQNTLVVSEEGVLS